MNFEKLILWKCFQKQIIIFMSNLNLECFQLSFDIQCLAKNWTVVQYYVVKWPFRPPSKKQNDTNDISFESPDIGLLEFKKKLGVASSRGRHCSI